MPKKTKNTEKQHQKHSKVSFYFWISFEMVRKRPKRRKSTGHGERGREGEGGGHEVWDVYTSINNLVQPIVIKYPDEHPDNISNQEIRSVQPNRPMNTGWRQQTMNMTPWCQNDWLCSQPKALSLDPMEIWQVRRTLGMKDDNTRLPTVQLWFKSTQENNKEGPSSLDLKQLSGFTWSSGSLMYSWVSKCFRPLHTMLSFSSLYSDTNSLIVKSANSFTFIPRERSIYIRRDFQISNLVDNKEKSQVPT